MTHPLLNLPPQTRHRLAWLLIALAVLMTAVMGQVGKPLNNDVAPLGIVSFEFAGDLATAQAMVDSWHGRSQLIAALSLGLDFLYPILYGLGIWAGCGVVAGMWLPSQRPFAQIGFILSWAVWAAVGFDYIENYALIQLLLGTNSTIWAPLAYGCAAVKFLLIILALLYALFSVVAIKIGAGAIRN